MGKGLAFCSVVCFMPVRLRGPCTYFPYLSLSLPLSIYLLTCLLISQWLKVHGLRGESALEFQEENHMFGNKLHYCGSWILTCDFSLPFTNKFILNTIVFYYLPIKLLLGKVPSFPSVVPLNLLNSAPRYPFPCSHYIFHEHAYFHQ